MRVALDPVLFQDVRNGTECANALTTARISVSLPKRPPVTVTGGAPVPGDWREYLVIQSLRSSGTLSAEGCHCYPVRRCYPYHPLRRCCRLRRYYPYYPYYPLRRCYLYHPLRQCCRLCRRYPYHPLHR